jgi:hypothetical protein
VAGYFSHVDWELRSHDTTLELRLCEKGDLIRRTVWDNCAWVVSASFLPVQLCGVQLVSTLVVGRDGCGYGVRSGSWTELTVAWSPVVDARAKAPLCDPR